VALAPASLWLYTVSLHDALPIFLLVVHNPWAPGRQAREVHCLAQVRAGGVRVTLRPELLHQHAARQPVVRGEREELDQVGAAAAAPGLGRDGDVVERDREPAEQLDERRRHVSESRQAPGATQVRGIACAHGPAGARYRLRASPRGRAPALRPYPVAAPPPPPPRNARGTPRYLASITERTRP